jgi:hypothetical protein
LRLAGHLRLTCLIDQKMGAAILVHEFHDPIALLPLSPKAEMSFTEGNGGRSC